MVDVKQAVDSAAKYFSALMTIYDARLEEVELSGDERLWHVTLSGLLPAPKDGAFGSMGEIPMPALKDLFKSPFEQVYKVFAVDAVTGSVRSMKMRRTV